MYDKQILNNLSHRGFIGFTLQGYLYTPTNTLSDTTFFFKIVLYAIPWLEFFVLKSSWK